MSKSMNKQYQEFEIFAKELAIQGGKKTLEYFHQDISVERKADESPVTIADRETELTMRKIISERYPDHAVVGEEFGGVPGNNEWEWILDPIDGTKSFIRGVPLYTTLVALVHNGTPVVGVIHAPAIGETVSAYKGGGCRDQSNRPVTVSECTALSDAWYMTTDPHDFALRHPAISETLLRSCRSSRTWGDGYGYMLVARGAVDVMLDPAMSAWDIAPLSVVIREAGGVFTSMAGETDDLGTSAVAASTEKLHNEVMAIIRKQAGSPGAGE